VRFCSPFHSVYLFVQRALAELRGRKVKGKEVGRFRWVVSFAFLRCPGGVADWFSFLDENEDEDSSTTRRTTNQRKNEFN
jgi:hypothetical protein